MCVSMCVTCRVSKILAQFEKKANAEISLPFTTETQHTYCTHKLYDRAIEDIGRTEEE